MVLKRERGRSRGTATAGLQTSISQHHRGKRNVLFFEKRDASLGSRSFALDTGKEIVICPEMLSEADPGWPSVEQFLDHGER